MKKFKFASLSIRKRLFIAIFIVLIVQVTFLAIGILRGSISQRLRHEYINIFDEKVIARKNYIQDTIKKYYTSLFEYEGFIQEKTLELFRSGKNIDNVFLEEISERAVMGLRQSGATGIFVVFDKGGKKQGFYIRDLEPSVVAADNSDLLFLYGPVSVARKIKLSLDRHWSSDFNLDEKDPAADFYYKPINAAIRYKDNNYKDLGYWGVPLLIAPQDVEVITYSIPLIDSKGEPYGVVGIDLTVDYLKNLLPYSELVETKQGAYMIGMYNIQKNEHRKVLATGPKFNKILNLEGELDYIKESEEKEIYKVNGDIYFSIHNVDLYNSDNPFIEETWYLAGIVEEEKLFGPIYQLTKSIIYILLVSLLLGILGIITLGNWFINPITSLIKQLLERDPNEKLFLKETNILELNELSKAIEIMNGKVADSFSKLSQIVDMINIPIGAFECVSGENHVYITDGMFSILDINGEEVKSNYIPVKKFNNIISEIKKYPERDAENVFLNKRSLGELNWLRIQTHKKENRILGIIEDVTDEILKRRQLEYERDLDPLTKLLNRRGFISRVRSKIEDGGISVAALVMWDLDNLKYINDTYGHDYGDQYIKLAAEILKELTLYDSIVARMSGDELYVFIYGHNNKQSVRDIIDCVQNKINSTYLIISGRNKIRLRASAGIAWYPDDSSNYEELIKYADFTMYQIKNSNKGNIGEFDKKIYVKDSILLYGKEELNNLIDNELVEYVFQPIVDTEKGEVYGYEALMRPQLDLIKSPLDLIRLAQSQSKSYEIERITLFNAMKTYVEKIDLFNGAKIFINSIPNHILTEKDIELFEEKFRGYLDRIVIEITESEQSSEERIKAKKEYIAKWGGKLALDDFGSGYNSEITLLLLSPDYIKVDKGIIRGIGKDQNRQKLFLNILSYTKPRGIKVIAEGVETKGELDTLGKLGADYVQGYYIGRPKSIPEKVTLY